MDWTTNKGSVMRVIPTEILDKDGNLTNIEYHNELGTFEFQAQWDPSEAQTYENREKFRKWADTMAKRLEFDVIR
jgi:hypothetical protein